MQGARKEQQPVNMEKAAADADAVYQAGVGRLGTEESEFIRMLAAESYEQLRAMFDAYERKYGETMEKSLAKELSGDFLDGMLAIGLHLFLYASITSAHFQNLLIYLLHLLLSQKLVYAHPYAFFTVESVRHRPIYFAKRANKAIAV